MRRQANPPSTPLPLPYSLPTSPPFSKNRSNSIPDVTFDDDEDDEPLDPMQQQKYQQHAENGEGNEKGNKSIYGIKRWRRMGVVVLAVVGMFCLLFGVRSRVGDDLIVADNNNSHSNSEEAIDMNELNKLIDKNEIRNKSYNNKAIKEEIKEEDKSPISPKSVTKQIKPSHSHSQSKPLPLLHLSHVPKCGGTSLSSILRRAICVITTSWSTPSTTKDAKNECCNPGECNPASHQSCPDISGCSSHNPNLHQVHPPSLPSHYGAFTMLRNPSSRAISAFYYHCHSPNSDCYHVDKHYCQSGMSSRSECGANYSRLNAEQKTKKLNIVKAKKKGDIGYISKADLAGGDEWREKVWSIDEYVGLEGYHNIYTRMFGTGGKFGSFPYTSKSDNERVTWSNVKTAKSNLERFNVVGILELYDFSVGLILAELGVPSDFENDFEKKRDNTLKPSAQKIQSDADKRNTTLIARIVKSNEFDVDVYEWVKGRLCGRAETEVGRAVIKTLKENGRFDAEKFTEICVDFKDDVT